MEYLNSEYNTPTQFKAKKQSSSKPSKTKNRLYEPKKYYKPYEIKTPPDNTHLISEKRNTNIIHPEDIINTSNELSGSLEAIEIAKIKPDKPIILTTKYITEETQTERKEEAKIEQPKVRIDQRLSRRDQLLSLWNSKK